MPKRASSSPGKGTPTAYAIPSLAQARALQAFSKGEASADQQKVAFNWIIRGACGAGKEPFVANAPDVTSYLNGRLSVSFQIGWVLAQPVDAFREQGETD